MKQIPLTRGLCAEVDDADYDWLSQWKWFARQAVHTFYAARNFRVAEGNPRTELMHRVILGLQPGDKQESDHRDGRGLNNQRSNLRICSVAQNQQSRRNQKVGTSRYKGVYLHSNYHKWVSRIVVNKKRIHLGCFDSETDAAIVYDLAASKYFGEFALTNGLR